MERCDKVNDSLSLIQKTDGLTFGTDALLLAGYLSGRFTEGCELGGGSGIISMLVVAREKVRNAVALEVQKEYVDLIEKNLSLNNLNDRLTAVHTDIREFRSEKEFDVVYTNPPYMKTSSGFANATDKKNIARHEVMGDINDFCKCASSILKFGGQFSVVYRPDRLADLMDAMRKNSLEAKRMTFVHADTEAEPSMVLIDAKKGGKSGMQLTRPLIIYKDRSHKEYSDDMNYIMENGSFPKYYKR